MDKMIIYPELLILFTAIIFMVFGIFAINGLVYNIYDCQYTITSQENVFCKMNGYSYGERINLTFIEDNVYITSDNVKCHMNTTKDQSSWETFKIYYNGETRW